jgi:hypothetical protein
LSDAIPSTNSPERGRNIWTSDPGHEYFLPKEYGHQSPVVRATPTAGPRLAHVHGNSIEQRADQSSDHETLSNQNWRLS